MMRHRKSNTAAAAERRFAIQRAFIWAAVGALCGAITVTSMLLAVKS
ncbi:MAG: hypothetical protein JWP85_2086 [Rhodoglobus sp.]|nr:hypothetical protein [Rhodoglobus sp.]